VTILWSQEFLTLVREHLAPGGTAAQWLPPRPHPEGEAGVYRMLLHTFHAVFPNSSLWQAAFSSVIVAKPDGELPAVGEFVSRSRAAPVAASLRFGGITDSDQLIEMFLAGPQKLSHFVAGAPLNTDDHPIVEYQSMWERRSKRPPVDPLRQLIESKEPISVWLR
jgi:spermidine synthase